MGGLLERCERAGTDVSLVSGPVGGGIRGEGAGFAQAVRVVAGAVYRVGDPREFAVEGAEDLHVQAGGLCLPEYSSGWAAQDQHGSRVPSTTYCVRSSSSSAVGT